MPHRSRALALTGAACVAAALAVAGCGNTSSSSSSSSSTISGNTLDIYISEPPHFLSDPAAQDVIDAEKLAYAVHRSEVKDFKLGLYTSTGNQVSDNARLAIENDATVAYLGEIDPGSSEQSVGITNALDILQISPTDTAAELGSGSSVISDSPQTYFESWGSYGRTFARLVPTSAQEAVAQVNEMKSLGVKSLYVGDDGSDYGRVIAAAVRKDAKGAGITLQTSLAGVDGVFYGVQSPSTAAKFFSGVAATDSKAKLFGPSSLDNGLFTEAEPNLHNLYVTIPGFMPNQLNASGKAFDKAFATAYGHEPNVEAIFGYEAMSALLTVLEKAGKNADSRPDVIKDFLKLSQTQSVLGSYSINSSGNTSLDAFVIAKLSNGTLVPFKAASTQG